MTSEQLLRTIATLITELINQKKVNSISDFFTECNGFRLKDIIIDKLNWRDTYSGFEFCDTLYSIVPHDILIAPYGLKSESSNWTLNVLKR